MTLLGKEHYELIAQFDKTFEHFRLDKEPKDLWPAGHIYQDGYVNNLFAAFRLGFAHGKAVSA
jgi:hypothetical protein